MEPIVANSSAFSSRSRIFGIPVFQPYRFPLLKNPRSVSYPLAESRNEALTLTLYLPSPPSPSTSLIAGHIFADTQ